ncbi:hypothetical protein Fot_32451 [Forsythia ovata]|uniref:Uncharacterized protein n=1 Tax=Forsythia ovata TaxID=205694 RepID=A0ABD1T7U7_9LAMI
MEAMQMPNHLRTTCVVRLSIVRELIIVPFLGPDPITQQRSLKQSKTCTLARMSPIKEWLLDKQVPANLKSHSPAHIALTIGSTGIALRIAMTYRHWQNKEPKRRIEPPYKKVEAGTTRHFGPTSCIVDDVKRLEIAD